MNYKVQRNIIYISLFLLLIISSFIYFWGIYFGTNVLIPQANPYLNIILNTIEGARGFFTKEEFITAAKDVGFTNFRFATPVTIFRFEK